MAAEQATYGATLADLGIEIVDWARAEPIEFGILLVIFAICGGILLAVFRGATNILRHDLQSDVSKQRDEE